MRRHTAKRLQSPEPPPAEDLTAAEEVYAEIARRAREDPALFCAFVLRDEETGRPIEMCDTHVEWHDIVSRESRGVLWSHIESGKTQQLAIGRALWELGADPSKRCVILARTDNMATKIVSSIGRYILHSEELHAVFPELRPSALGEPWTQNKLTVARPKSPFPKDPSVQAVGIDGDIMGSRIDYLFGDDILNFENTWTPAQRDKVTSVVELSAIDRLSGRGKAFFGDVTWHPEDPLHRWAARRGWFSRKYPVQKEDGQPRWPQRWSLKRIAEFRDGLGPASAAIKLDLNPRDDSKTLIKRDWLQHYWPAGPDGQPLERHWDQVIQSWDLSFLATDTSSYVVGEVWGARGAVFDLLDEVRGRMGIIEAMAAVRALTLKWPIARRKLIEKAANGIPIRELLAKDVPGIEWVVSSKSKYEKMLACQPLFAAGNVRLPPPQHYRWVLGQGNDIGYVAELTQFTAAEEKPNDRVDATSHALQHLYALRKEPAESFRLDLLRR